MDIDDKHTELPTVDRCVIFGTPSYSRQVVLGFWMASLQTEMMLCEKGIAHGYIPVGGDPYLSKARNNIVTQFLEDYTMGTDLFFIDDDVSWDAASVLRILDHPGDIVCGLYPQKKDDPTFPFEMTVENGCEIEMEGAVEANLLPTGFMRIKRHVLEAMAKDARRYEESDQHGVKRKMYNIFEMGVAQDTDEWWGEDFAFSLKARRLGFRMWFIPDLTFGHQGTKVWTASIAPMLAEWKARNKPVKGPSPTISVLIPSRGRPDSLRSVLLCMGQHEGVQVIVGLDDDDPTMDEARETCVAQGALVVVSPRPETVGQVFESLYPHATGEWIMPFWDDYKIVETDWPARLRATLGDPMDIPYLHDPLYPGFATCPVLSRAMIAAAGFVVPPWFPFWFMDTWWNEIGILTGGKVPVPVSIENTPEGEDHYAQDIKWWTDFFESTRPMRLKLVRKMGIEPTVASIEACDRIIESMRTPQFIAVHEAKKANPRFTQARRSASRFLEIYSQGAAA